MTAALSQKRCLQNARPFHRQTLRRIVGSKIGALSIRFICLLAKPPSKAAPEQCAHSTDSRKQAATLAQHIKRTFDPTANGIACAINDGIDDAFGLVFTLDVEWREEHLPTRTGEGIFADAAHGH